MANNNKKMDPVKAGAIGAGIGVIAGATMAALSNKDTREAIGKKVDELNKKAQELGEEAKAKVQSLTSKAKQDVKKGADALSDKIDAEMTKEQIKKTEKISDDMDKV